MLLLGLIEVFVHSSVAVGPALLFIARTVVAQDLMRDVREAQLAAQLRLAVWGFADPWLAGH